MRIALSLLLLALVSSPASAKMYKWVDEHGVTQYGDAIPPQYANKPNSEMNSRGTVLKKNEGALTPEQRKAHDEEEAKKSAEQQKSLERQRKDRALLNTYANEAEIDRARDRSLQLTELQIKNAGVQAKSIQERLNKSRALADAATRSKKPVPPAVQHDIQSAESELQQMQEAIQRKQAELAATRTRFEEDKARLRELRQLKN